MDKFVLTDNFIFDYIDEDIASGKAKADGICTRVPPEPNGYLHLGHVKSICINFGTAMRYDGKCFLYFDDTNPVKEKDEFVQSIKEDISWLGFEPYKVYFASDHYQDLYDIAVKLIKAGKAYVCNLTQEEVREYRGTLTTPGKESPYRNRSIEENLDLFTRMKNGEFPEGYCTLRAKIDMASPILCMRDPVIYRIMYVTHHRTGDKWCIYPMYDFASPLLDALEGVTHSLCGPEFEERRPLYNWSVQSLGLFKTPPRQIEFAKINVSDVILGKRYLKNLVETGIVSGWDDPRMPTIAGMRRRGYTPEALKSFINVTGVSKALSEVDFALLEHCVRDELQKTTDCKMAVIDPIKLVIDNYEGEEELIVPNKPGEGAEERKVKFTKELYIDADDFKIDPPPKYFRMFVGQEVRLNRAYIVKCTRYEETDEGIVVHADYYPDSKSGSECTRKVKGTIHWVSAKYAKPATIRLYDKLIDDTVDGEVQDKLNKESLIVKQGFIEPSLAECEVGERYQFMRCGYFIKDRDSTVENPVFNRIIGLKDKYKAQIKQ